MCVLFIKGAHTHTTTKTQDEHYLKYLNSSSRERRKQQKGDGQAIKTHTPGPVNSKTAPRYFISRYVPTGV